MLDGIGSRRTRGQALALIRAVLNRALDDEEIQTNPAARWRLTSAELGEVADFGPATPAELDRIADAIARRFRALIFVLAYGALRFSEACALRRDDIDEPNCRIRIDERLLEVSSTGQLHFGEPKTSKSRSWVPLPRFVMEELVAHIEAFVDSEDPHALIFTSARGGPIRRSNFLDRPWKKALEAAKLTGRFSPMQLRHAGGSLAHEAGASERDVAELLRQTSTRMASRYVRAYEDRRRRIADAMEELARPQPGTVRRIKRA